ncbi:RluA family pseudouridine synthase [Candidatus Odyssella thessalonicensis]|uniref:RluA family pseudouridine synthase n=1 Tax=Candidatus Odyssella thessalonicensis TaxID=84647 RepID=UPI000225A89F|nr:RluA family pseudouridine synthase [Candidatus Odyssella thessalonicensis]
MAQPTIHLVEDSEGMRLDRWLKKQVPDLRQSVLERLLRTGKIRLNDTKVTAGHRIAVGDVVSIWTDLEKYKNVLPQLTMKEAPSLSPEEIEFFKSLIIWEDEDLLIINKPSGLAVQGGTKTFRHVDRYLAGLGELNNCRYRLTHRIDRDTSGLLVIAKKSDMATHLTQQFKDGKVEKIYWAVTLGQPRPGSGILKAPLIKAGVGDKEKVVVDFETGKPAITVYQTLKRLEKPRLPYMAWVELKPQTGRTHQLRVHCVHLDAPILGDGKYGGKEVTDIHRTLHLHARSITIRDRDGNKLTFQAPPPAHFTETLARYGIEWSRII